MNFQFKKSFRLSPLTPWEKLKKNYYSERLKDLFVYLAVFGVSVFDESTIPLNGIKDIVYDYYDSYEEDLYSEDFYGDYDETFSPPPEQEVPDVASSNPFGVDINFEDYALSDIRNIEYEYDYDDDYEDNVEYNEVDVEPLSQPDPDLKIKLEETSPPVIHYKYKLFSPGKEYVRLTPTQLKYMGMMGVQKPARPASHQSHQRRPTTTSPLELLVSSVQNKLDFLLGLLTTKMKLPKIVG